MNLWHLWDCRVAAVQRLLGHRDLASTSVYPHLDDTDLRAALNTHPGLVKSWPPLGH